MSPTGQLHCRRTADLRPAPAHYRSALPWLVLVALLMLVLFVVGGSLPVPLDPASVALGGAVATLLYFSAVFVLVGGLERSGALDSVKRHPLLVLWRHENWST